MSGAPLVDIVREFELFRGNGAGIESWISSSTPPLVLGRLGRSQGKPVIFFCDAETRSNFYREVHPLSRLINFTNGVPVGAIVTDKIDDVIEIIKRVLTNEMAYELQQGKPGHFQLSEKRTKSIVRLQTADILLREAFWNYYNVGHRQ
jgi:hypothetical protein